MCIHSEGVVACIQVACDLCVFTVVLACIQVACDLCVFTVK